MIKLHDIVKYKNHEWYVIKIKEKLVTLMTKDILSSETYSSDNSNDWEKSNVRDLLDGWLLDSDLIIGELVEMKTNYDENKRSSDLIRIPTLREIESLPMDIRNCGKSYWTMTSSYGVSEDCGNAIVFGVDSDGYLYNNYVSNTYGVRPVITMSVDKLEVENNIPLLSDEWLNEFKNLSGESQQCIIKDLMTINLNENL